MSADELRVGSSEDECVRKALEHARSFEATMALAQQSSSASELALVAFEKLCEGCHRMDVVRRLLPSLCRLIAPRLREAGREAWLEPSRAAGSPWARRWKLSPRYAQVVAYIALGHSDREIAREMGISFNTARTYVSKVYQRAGVHSRVELVQAMERSLWTERDESP